MMKVMLLFISLFCIPSAFAGIYITEIMYDPSGSDNNKEYVEVYSDEELNLSGYLIEDAKSQDVLIPLVIQNDSSYALIVEEGYNDTNSNLSLYNAGATIGDQLNNDGDIILLKDNLGNVLDTISYDKSMGASGNDKALCRDITNNLISECTPTPGAENEVNETADDDEEEQKDEEEEKEQDFSPLLINEVFPDPEGDDNAPLPDGEWIELYNGGTELLELAGLKVCDKSNNCVTIDSSHVIEQTTIGPRGYLVVYTNGRGILNNNGFEEVILKGEETIDKISYTDSEFGYSWSLKDETFVLTWPTPGKENKQDEQKEEEKKKQETSYINIEKIEAGSNNTAQFGDTIKIKTTIYKGKTNKNSVKAYVRDLTTPILFDFENELMSYSLTIPLQLPSNCDNKHKDGSYTVIMEGLDDIAERNLTIQGARSCPSEKKTANATTTSLKGERLINDPTTGDITGKSVYESKDLKIKGYAVYLFYGVLALIIIYFLLIHGRKTEDKVDH